MKNFLILLVLLLATLSNTAHAFKYFEGDTTFGAKQKPDVSAVVDMVSTTKGFLPPRMTTGERNGILTPTVGLSVFNLTDNQFQIYNGAFWAAIGGGGADHPLWTTGTAYGVGAVVIEPSNFKVYRANTGHVAGATFLGDIAFWDELSDPHLLDGNPNSITYFSSTGLVASQTNFSWNGSAMGIGTPTPVAKLTLSGIGGNTSQADVRAYTNNNVSHPVYRLRRSFGSEAAPTRVFAPAIAGRFDFQSHNGVNFVQSSYMESLTTESYSGISGAANLSFWTNPSGVAGPLVSLTLNDDQTADFAAHVSTPSLTVGNLHMEGNEISSTSGNVEISPAGDIIFPKIPSGFAVIDGGNAITSTANINTTSLTGDFAISTGIYTGGFLSAATPTTLFSISDGGGVVVDSSTDPLNPVRGDVNWSGLTNIAATGLASLFTSIAIDSAGTVIQKAGLLFTAEERRDNIVLGLLIHPAGLITGLAGLKDVAFGGLHNVQDMGRSIGIVNVDGNNYSANGVNLQIDRAAGTIFELGSNYENSSKSPNLLTNLADISADFLRMYQDGGGGYTTSTPTGLIDPALYDDGSGTLATVPNNRWTTKRIYLGPISATNVVVMGQTLYLSQAAAEAGIFVDDFKVNPALSVTTLRTILVVKGNTTDLSDGAQANFIEVGKFGESTIGSTSPSSISMQTSYENSTQPQILLDSTRLGIQYIDAATPILDNLFSILGNAGQEYFTVSSTGVYIGGTVDHVGDYSQTGDFNTTGMVSSSSSVIGIGTLTPSSSFDTFSTTQGTRPFSRMTEAQRDAIVSPAEGLFVWNLDTNKLNNYDGTLWSEVAGSGGGSTVTATGVAFGNGSNELEADPSKLSFDSTTEELSAAGGYNDGSFTSGLLLVSVGSKISEATPLIGDQFFTGADLLPTSMVGGGAVTVTSITSTGGTTITISASGAGTPYRLVFGGGGSVDACTSSPCTIFLEDGPTPNWINGNVTKSASSDYSFVTNGVFAANSWVSCHITATANSLHGFCGLNSTSNASGRSSFRADASGIIDFRNGGSFGLSCYSANGSGSKQNVSVSVTCFQ